jgi:hypothetical protein
MSRRLAINCPKVGAIACGSHIKATRPNLLWPTRKLDASPHRRDAGILEPDPEVGG